jgi:hypothetical protein
MIAQAPRYLRFVRADVEPVNQDQCRARVEVQLPEWSSFVGLSDSVCTPLDTVRAAAEASLQALSKAIGPREGLALTGVEQVQAFGKSLVLVELMIPFQGESRAVVGVCLAGDNPTRAAALAVLNAANRSLGTG